MRAVTEADKGGILVVLRQTVYPHQTPSEWALDPEDAPAIEGDLLEKNGRPVGYVLVSVRETTFAWPRHRCDPERDRFEDEAEYDRLHRLVSGPCLFLEDIGLLPEHRGLVAFHSLLAAALNRAADRNLPFEACLRESTTGRLRRVPFPGWKITARVKKLRHCGFLRADGSSFEPYDLVRLERV